jgi:LemA protein
MRRSFAPIAAAVLVAGCGVNSVPTAEEEAKARWADVQAAYQRRADLIGNLVATVRAASRAENETLTNVINARARATQVQVSGEELADAGKVQQFAAAQAALSVALRPVQEAYPQLRSQEGFLRLQDQLEGTENRITNAVRDYNSAVQAYNTRIRTFPDAIGARVIHGAKPLTPFQAVTPGAERAPNIGPSTFE